MSGDYDVGFGKPPKQHRFQKGNKMARRRKGEGKQSPDFTMSAIITEAMSQLRQIRRGDRIVNMRVADIMIERLVQMATTGSAREIRFVMALIERHAAHLVAPPVQEINVIYHRAAGSNVELPPRGLWEAGNK